MFVDRSPVSGSVTEFINERKEPLILRSSPISFHWRIQGGARDASSRSKFVGSLRTFDGHIFIVVQGQFRELVQLAEKYQKPRISTKLIKDLLAASNNDAAQKCLKLVEKEKGAGN